VSLNSAPCFFDQEGTRYAGEEEGEGDEEADIILKNKMKKRMKENKEEGEIHKLSERDIKPNAQMHTGAHCTSLHCLQTYLA
jgi:hypothetical protein